MTRILATASISRSAAALLAIAGLLLGIGAQLWIPLGSPMPGDFSDSVDYLAFADYFRGAFHGQLTPDLNTFFASTRFPPLFPLALSAFGAGLSMPLPAYWVTSLATIASFALALIWLTHESGSRLTGLLLASSIAVNPGVFMLSLSPVSEPLFLVLVLTILLWSRRIERGSSLLVFAAFTGLLPLCRMAGVATVAATAMWIVARRLRTRRERFVAIAFTLLPSLAWQAYRKLLPVQYSYADALSLERALSAFGGWTGWFFGQPHRIADAYAHSLSPWIDPPAAALVLAAALFALGLWLRLRRVALDALMLAVYLLVIFCWPYPAELPRLVLVTLPMALLCSWEGIRWLIGRLPVTGLSPAATAATLVAAGAAALSMPFAIEASQRAMAPVEPELEPFKRGMGLFLPVSRSAALDNIEISARIASLMDATGSIVGADDCVYTFFPIALYFHVPHIDARPMPYPAEAGKSLPEQFSACRYVLVSSQTSLEYEQPPLYPLLATRGWMKPALISTMKVDGRTIIAAALLTKMDAPRTSR